MSYDFFVFSQWNIPSAHATGGATLSFSAIPTPDAGLLAGIGMLVAVAARRRTA